MAKYLNIQIHEPCGESWEKMSPDSNGRFCASCQKKVIDFTGLTDNQVLEYFQKNPRGVCGRFYSNQLENPIPLPQRKISWVKYFIQISIPALLFSFKAGAQKLLHKSQVEVVIPAKNSFQRIKADSTRRVSGKVMDPVRGPVAFASIIVPGSSRGTATDSEGNFTITLSGFVGFLEVSSVGYESKTVPVDTSENTLFITLTEKNLSQCFVLGGAVSAVVVRSKKPRKKKVQEKFAKAGSAQVPAENAVTVFPNPVKAFSYLTLRWKNPIKANQELSIYDITGNLVQKERIFVKNPTNETSFKLRMLDSGAYFLHLTDTGTGKALTTQILVE